MSVQRKYTWVRDPNYKTTGQARKVNRTAAKAYPPVTDDLSAYHDIPCYDQLSEGSCTSQAWNYAGEFVQYEQKFPKPVRTSRQAFYAYELQHDGNLGQDAGSTLTTGQWVMQNVGIADESLYPYDPNAYGVLPPKSYAEAAAKMKGVAFTRVDTSIGIVALKAALMERRVVVCGFDVFKAFEGDEVANTGIVPNPAPGEQSVGGHAVVLVKLDDTRQKARFRNSWGTEWGMANDAGKRGYFEVNYNYLMSSMFSDFWVLETLTEPPTPSALASFLSSSVSALSFHRKADKEVHEAVTDVKEAAADAVVEVKETATEVKKETTDVVAEVKKDVKAVVAEVKKEAAEVKKDVKAVVAEVKKDLKPEPIKPDFTKPIYGRYVPFPDPVKGPSFIMIYDQTPPEVSPAPVVVAEKKN